MYHTLRGIHCVEIKEGSGLSVPALARNEAGFGSTVDVVGGSPPWRK